MYLVKKDGLWLLGFQRTGLREFEDQDNARYYAEEAERIAVGGFATKVYVENAITAAFDCGGF